MRARRRASGGLSGMADRAPAFTSAATAMAEASESPRPAPTSFLIASALPSSIATRGVAPALRNHSSITCRIVPPRS